jgi:MBG domain
MPLPSRRSTTRRFALGLAAAVALWSGVSLLAQIPGRNVNMVAGTEWPGGDPFLQRQNEPSMAASTRNPLHLVAGSNDYRTVDLPGLPDDVETGDAWVSVYKSFDGGARWSSTLMPGYPQDTSAAGLASPLKGYQAAADPVVRAGTNGLIYYNGLVFDRGDNGKSGIFLARFVDQNNKENGDPIAYLGTSMVASSNGTVFLDKPWMAVDLPRANAPLCVVGGVPTGGRVKRAGHRLRGNSGQTGNAGFVWVDPGLQYVPAGAIYVAYTSITGDGSTLRAEILLKRSLDCGATWSAPLRVSRATDAINQGATISIDPVDGDVFVAYRRFATPEAPTADAVMVSRLPVGQLAFGPAGMARALPRTDSPTAALDRIFEHRKKRAQTQSAPSAVTSTTGQIDQGTSPYSFRTNSYPSMAIDGSSRVYVAWSERGFAGAVGRQSAVDGDARIRVATTLDGATFSAPVTVEDPTDGPTGPALPGHQLMPSMAFSGGKLLLVFYDLRETRAGVFGPFVSDQGLTSKRQTIDIRASLGTPGATPVFAPSVRVSDYLVGYTDSTSTAPRQLQFNPPNLPMFKLGTVPFIGDYIDVAPSPAFVPTGGGGWAFNTAAGIDFPLFHAVWTDNRDVRPPRPGSTWADYTPPTINGVSPGTSLFDPGQQVAMCQEGNAGSRNQNIYTARISGGLLVGSPGNSKPLSPTVQRGFVVFAQNQTTVTKTFRMSIVTQPPGGRASFEQFLFPPPPVPPGTPPPPPPPLPALVTEIYVRVPARSTASRTVYATSTNPKAQIDVNVSEVGAVGGTPLPGGLAGRTVLNPDIENPDIENPDIENPDIENPDIENAEVYNPDIENPDIENPDIQNPDIENPDIENPDIENPDIENPDIENIVVDNSTIANPDIENPDIENPDIENPDIENSVLRNGTISDVTWTVSNIGNTTSAFNVNVFLAAAGVPSGINTQLIVYKTYKTPVLALDGCSLKTETRNVVFFNVPSPNFVSPGVGLPDQNDPSEKNATLWLNPGEVGRVTLRVYDNDRSDNVIVTNLDGTTASIDPRFNPATVTTVGISAQGVDVSDPPGATEPPAVTTTGTNLFFLQQPTSVAPGALIAPSVRVRVWDNTGAPLSGVTVNLALCGPQALLLPTVVADGDGIATFSTLAVSQAASGLTLRATAASPGVVAAGTSAPFDVAFPGGPWSATGSGVVTLLDSGGSGTPAFSYDNPGVFSGAWTLSRVASATETVNLTYAWNGFHSYFTVTTGLEVFVRRGGVDVHVQSLVNEPLAGEGPVVCCAFPSGGFAYAGAAAVSVQAGDTYGFRLSGSHGDGTYAMNGTFSVVAGGTPQFTVAVRGTAGGFENQTPGHGPTSVPARVYGGVLSAGQQVTIVAAGLVQRGAAFAPNGAGGTGTCDGSCLLAGAPIGSLLARVGSGPWQLVGFGPTTITASSAGLLQFAINDNIFDDNTGGFLATVAWGAPAQPTVSIGNWAQIYDDTPKAVTVTTVPSGLATAVTYNGSPTVPSAIGAYTVEALAAGPGYLGRGSVNETIASTVSAGGAGGGPYERYCDPGVFANGVRPSTNSYYGLAGAQLLCTNLNHPPRVVGTPSGPYTETDVTCAPGEVMVGLHGQTALVFGAFTVVQNIGPRCRPAGGGGITDVPAIGANYYGDTFSLTCPSGAVTGVVGGIGEVVDSLALVCAPTTQFTETVITGDSSILNDGVLIAANDLGDFPDAVTVNGVLFGTDQGGLIGSWQPQDPGDFSQDGFSVTLDAVLSDLQFSNTLLPVNLTVGGLTPGASYRLQLLFSNDLNPTGDRVNVTVQGATWVLDDWRPNPINLTVQFTATSTSAVVTFAPGAGSTVDSGRAVLNGYVIHRMTP